MLLGICQNFAGTAAADLAKRSADGRKSKPSKR